jgi:hypothetical protein
MHALPFQLFRNANAGGKITFADYLDYTERQVATRRHVPLRARGDMLVACDEC